MNSIFQLIKGEVIRLFKYKIIFFGMLVSLIWLLIIAFQTKEQAQSLIPILIVTDSGMMAIVLCGASFYFEKQENTVKSLLVSPVSLLQILLSKIISAIVSALVSLIIVVGFAVIFHGIEVQLFKLFVYMLAIVISHTAIGYIIILKNKDFLSMLVVFSGIILLFYVPTLLMSLEILTPDYEYLALLSPSYSGEYLVKSSFIQGDWGKQLFAFIYLMGLGIGCYAGYVYRKYKLIAIEG